MVGLYYDAELTNASQHLTAQDAVTHELIPSVDPILMAILRSSYRKAAAFANITYAFSSAFDVTGGMRFARNKQVLRQTASGLLAQIQGTSYGGSSDNVFTYAISPRYRPILAI